MKGRAAFGIRLQIHEAPELMIGQDRLVQRLQFGLINQRNSFGEGKFSVDRQAYPLFLTPLLMSILVLVIPDQVNAVKDGQTWAQSFDGDLAGLGPTSLPGLEGREVPQDHDTGSSSQHSCSSLVFRQFTPLLRTSVSPAQAGR